MTDPPWLWLRNEDRATERRAPIVPADAQRLIDQGIRLTVEESAQRVFTDAEYAAAGATVVAAGSWADAPEEVFVVGLKELPAAPTRLPHRHIYFGHAYKGQSGAPDLLGRFVAGGGALLDLEYLTDDTGRRSAAFGYWAGYAGAALAVLHLRGALRTPLQPLERTELDSRLRAHHNLTTALVIGALGRSGRGSRDALTTAGISATAWDLAETRELDTAALLRHRILINTVLTTGPATPLLTESDLDSPRRDLRVICDVTCDVSSEHNMLPIYDRVTTWDEPVRRLREHLPLDIIAIDNLPSLLPREASVAFSADLLPLLRTLDPGSGPWARALRHFRTVVKELPHG
jgi:saccharopine dehydrogenase (NAD+, L-lysine-forming)